MAEESLSSKKGGTLLLTMGAKPKDCNLQGREGSRLAKGKINQKLAMLGVSPPYHFPMLIGWIPRHQLHLFPLFFLCT